MDKEILKLAYISYNLNNPAVGDNIMHLNLDRTYSIRIIKGVFDIKENTAYVTDKTPNANLFFHPWLYLYNEFEDISPYIGIFHPYGSIYAHNNSNFLNKLQPTSQNYHAPQEFSPNNSNIYIDHNSFGDAIVVCVNNLVSFPIKGRIELLISLSNNTKITHDNADEILKNKICNEFILNLSKLEELKIILLQDKYKLLFDSKNTNIITKPDFIHRAGNNSNGLYMFDYTNGSKAYNKLLHVNFPIENKNIPYFEEIKNNLPESIRDKVIWEFGIQIIKPYIK